MYLPLPLHFLSDRHLVASWKAVLSDHRTRFSAPFSTGAYTLGALGRILTLSTPQPRLLDPPPWPAALRRPDLPAAHGAERRRHGPRLPSTAFPERTPRVPPRAGGHRQRGVTRPDQPPVTPTDRPSALTDYPLWPASAAALPIGGSGGTCAARASPRPRATISAARYPPALPRRAMRVHHTYDRTAMSVTCASWRGEATLPANR